MASLTAIELGADTCAFARTSVHRGEVTLLAAEVLEPAAFPGIEAFTTAVRRTRQSMRLPRRCRAVVWGLPDGANRKDAAVKPLLEPLTRAGFRVQRVVSPCNALAALARLKSSRLEGSMCWIAINRGGVAIVVIRPGKQLYAHSFAWDSTIGASGSQARLLQRYSLVAFLSPEVKRAMAEARKAGTPVDAVITCGNLPELRSLTMPLIEELDIEVETLDSLEGLTVKPAIVDKLGESAASIRIACAAAVARGTRPWDPSKKRTGGGALVRYAQAALFAGAALGLGYWYLKVRLPPAPAPVTKRAIAPPAAPAKAPSSASATSAGVPAIPVKTNAPAAAPASTPRAVTAPAATPKSSAPQAVAPAPAPKPAPPGVSVAPPVVHAASAVPARPPVGKPVAATASIPRPAVQPTPTLPRPNVRAPSVSRAPVAAVTNPPANAQPAAAPPVRDTRAAAARPAPPDSPPAVPAPRPSNNAPGGSVLRTSAAPADKPEAGPATRAPVNGPLPALLKDAVPRVTAILVSRDRRFATVEGGLIVGVGDLVGRRTVVSMDERSVLLQEPSGVLIRIGLGGRLLGVERAIR